MRPAKPARSKRREACGSHCSSQPYWAMGAWGQEVGGSDFSLSASALEWGKRPKNLPWESSCQRKVLSVTHDARSGDERRTVQLRRKRRSDQSSGMAAEDHLFPLIRKPRMSAAHGNNYPSFRNGVVAILEGRSRPPSVILARIFTCKETVMKLRGIFCVAVMIALFALGSAWAKGRADDSNDYLALGDSVAFGYINQAQFEYYNPINFVGYPDWTGLAFGLDLSNASCPGETTGSFLSTTAPDNGCRLYRELTQLHVNYGSATTQFAYAVGFLQTNPNTALVTLQLGSNDVALLEEQCNNNPQCIASGLPQVLATATANMATILAGLRATGYSGTLVIANYYSPDYSNQTTTEITAALNQAITAPAPAYGAVVADVFSAFQAAVSNQFAQGKTCVAGLLNAQPGSSTVLTCDDHPSQSGHKLIAQTIAGVDQSPRRKDGK